MTPFLNDCPSMNISFIAQACAITFQGNASNNLQQDTFFFLDNWYQEDLGVMAVTPVAAPFCLAVSDGVASSSRSQHCSNTVVKAISRLCSHSFQTITEKGWRGAYIALLNALP